MKYLKSTSAFSFYSFIAIMYVDAVQALIDFLENYNIKLDHQAFYIDS